VPPPKKVEQTDAIFERLSQVNPQADRAEDTLRLALDAKATVNVGPFSRRGKSRTRVEAADHDFQPEATLTPFDILLPEHDDLTLDMARSKVTSDFIVDRLQDWWEANRERLPGITKLVLNLDNGPENPAAAPSSSSGWSDSPTNTASASSWRTTRRITASTTRSSGAGASWNCTGTGRCWTRSRRCRAKPGR
jgi:hypothetical protein